MHIAFQVGILTLLATRGPPPPLYPGAGLYETKEMNTTDEPGSILETKTTLFLVFKS